MLTSSESPDISLYRSSNGAAWSPAIYQEWGSGDEGTCDNAMDISLHDKGRRDREPESRTDSPTRLTEEKDHKEVDGYLGYKKPHQGQDKEDGKSEDRGNREANGLSAVSFRFPVWYTAQGQDEAAPEPDVQRKSNMSMLSHEAGIKPDANGNDGTRQVGHLLTPSLQQQYYRIAPSSSEPDLENMPVQHLQSVGQRPSSGIAWSMDNQSDSRPNRIGVSSRCIRNRPRAVDDFLRYPGPPPSLLLPDYDMADKMITLEGAGRRKNVEHHGTSAAQHEVLLEETSQMKTHQEAMRSMPTPPSSPRIQSSPTTPNKLALPVEQVAERIYPFVLDRDGYLFECHLRDGVKILEIRASERWRWKHRPKLPRSGLCRAWTVENEISGGLKGT